MVRSLRLLGQSRHTIVPLLFVVLVTGALAGCTGTGDDLDSPDADGQEGGGSGGSGGSASGGGGNGGGEDEGPDPSFYRFEVDGPEERTLEASGAFAVTEHCIPQCFISEDGYAERVDLSEIMPLGVPVEVQVDLQYDREYIGTVGGYFLSDGALSDQGLMPMIGSAETVVAALPDPESRLYFVVEGYIPDSAEDNEWTLQATAKPLVDQIPSGFPVAFQVDDPAAHPKILSGGLSDPPFLIYGPDDTLLGTPRPSSNLTMVFEQSGEAGEYVVFIPWGSPMLRIKAEDGEPGSLRLLKIEREQGDFQGPLPGMPSEWSFDVDRHPIAVGLLLRSEQGYLNIMSDIRLESPETTLYSQNCGICGGTLLGTTERIWWFHGLQDGVVPGTYEVYHEDNGRTEEATHVVWTHVR